MYPSDARQGYISQIIETALHLMPQPTNVPAKRSVAIQRPIGKAADFCEFQHSRAPPPEQCPPAFGAYIERKVVSIHRV